MIGTLSLIKISWLWRSKAMVLLDHWLRKVRSNILVIAQAWRFEHRRKIINNYIHKILKLKKSYIRILLYNFLENEQHVHIAFQFTMTERSFSFFQRTKLFLISKVSPHGLIFQNLQNFLRGYMDFKIFFIQVSNLS